MVVCASCGQENPDIARFCFACAKPIDAAPLREERKTVTVLFTDLVGFTSRAERMDPEDVRAMLSRYHQRVRLELERHGGTVEKFIGDAVMALFGAPAAHEDDPERAVRAALAIRDAIAELNEQEPERELRVRIGITTGETLVTLGARPAEGEAMAAGDVVNTAARLQAAAPVDGILVDEPTFHATARVIEYQEHASIDAKGKGEPVRVWQATQALARFGTDVRQIGGSRLVGRTRELETLVDAHLRSIDEGAAQLVTLIGVPGIGKSRLVWELFRRIDDSEQIVYWRQGRSLPYGEGVAFWALGEMVKAHAGILETDDAAAAAEKVQRSVAALLEDEREASWVAAHLGTLVGLDHAATGADRRGELFAAWRRFFEALAQGRPLVLVFEDLHWADDDLLDFVDHLVDWAGSVPVLVVGTARPELLERRPGWGGGKKNAATLSLSPLTDQETSELVHALLDRAVLPAEIQRALVERSEGNPLYAEEFVRLSSEGRELAQLPETIQGIIAARLDALAADEKAVLQAAAVVGKVFWLGAIAEISGSTRWVAEELLHRLERKEFVRRDSRPSVAGEVEYAFRHALVRDAAYGQIPRGARAEKHQLAAAWIDSLGRPEDHAEMLAHHYKAALELGRAAGLDVAALAGPARRALSAAGDRAFGLNAFVGAARLYEEALALEPDESEQPLLLFRLAQTHYWLGEERRAESLDEAAVALLAAGDQERAAEAETLLAQLWWHRGAGDTSLQHLERASELVANRPASEAKARVLADLSRFHALAEENDQALRVGLEAVEMARQFGLAEVEARALNNVGLAKCHVWDLSGLDDLRRSIEIALAANSPEAARGHNNLGSVLWEVGDMQESFAQYEEAVRVGKRLGNAVVTDYATPIVIEQRFWLGHWDEALRSYDDLLAKWESGDGHYLENAVRIDRATIRVARGDKQGAIADVLRAIEHARAVKDPQALLPTLASGAQLFSELGLVEEGRRAAEEALSDARSGSLLWGLVVLAFAADRLGVRNTVGQHVERLPDLTRWRGVAELLLDGDFAAAAETFDALPLPLHAARARLAAAEQMVAQGQRAQADYQLQMALTFFRSVRATRYIGEAESLLTASA